MSASVRQGFDVCGSNVVRQVQKNSFPANYQNLVGLSHRGPKHPRFITYQSRLETFYANNWPRSMPQKPEALAEAGFYYEGDNKNELIKIKIKYLLISKARITQEWHLIVNTAITENQRVFRHIIQK